MLYYLFRFLEQFGIPGSGMWQYISFRALLALIVALVVSAWFGEHFIKYMKRKHITETQRDVKIDPFGVKKIGVPSMGGIIIIVAVLVPTLLLGRLRNIYLILMVVTTVWLGLVGFADDYIKIFRKNKDGLAGKYKLLAQMLLGLVVGLTLYLSPDAVIHENVTRERGTTRTEIVHKSSPEKSTKTTIPFVKNNNFDYSSVTAFLGRHQGAGGWAVFVLMTVFVIMAVSNGANLNDGMDGMAAGNSAIILLALGVLAYFSSHVVFANYFNIMYIPGSQELVVFTAAMVGALIGFLWYNAYPAQVFMGDTGSLCIGGIIAVLAVIIHKELLLPLLCFIFLMESLSVMLQVGYYKIGKRRGVKQRIFKRTPIHDNFRVLPDQLSPDCKYVFNWPRGAWHESKITVRFWITSILLAAAAIITLKIR